MSLEDPREAFRKWQETHAEPVAESVKAEAERELSRDLLLDAMHERQARDKEVDRGAILASMPEGELFKTGVASEKIPKAIQELTQARKALIEGINEVPDADLFGDTQRTNFGMLEEALERKDDAARLSKEMKSAINEIRKYMAVAPEVTLFDLPGLMEEFISKLQREKAHLGDSSRASEYE